MNMNIRVNSLNSFTNKQTIQLKTHKKENTRTHMSTEQPPSSPYYYYYNNYDHCVINASTHIIIVITINMSYITTIIIVAIL